MNKEKLFSITEKDFKWSHIRGSGPGGQHRNKTSTGVRVEHPDSGAMATATDSKSQRSNKKSAFKRIIETDKFKKWFRMEIARKLGKLHDIEGEVEILMQPDNIKTEIQDDGKWVEQCVEQT